MVAGPTTAGSRNSPRPLTKLTWDNAALIAPAMANRLGLKTGDVVELRVDDRTVTAPIMLLPGQADRCVTVHLGYGRKHAGSLATSVGFDAYALQSTTNRWCVPGLKIRKLGGDYALATTQHHFSMEGRDIVRVADLDHFRPGPRLRQARPGRPSEPPAAGRTARFQDLRLGPHRRSQHLQPAATPAWSPARARTTSPVVGKDQVSRGREMHWIRVDRYFEGSGGRSRHVPAAGHVYALPRKRRARWSARVAGHRPQRRGPQHDGLQPLRGHPLLLEQLPYKVRRFNFLEYSPPEDSSFGQRQNPNVTVRRRGVMEKCTYCVQRINEARIDADLGDRKIRDGEIQTACQQVCPAQAITFGNLLDPDSQVSQRKREPVNYGLLAELNTQPPHDLPRAGPQSSHREGGRMNEAPVISPEETYLSITRHITDTVLKPTSWGWWIGFVMSGGLAGILGISLFWLFYKGVGIWGINMPVAWGTAIINYVCGSRSPRAARSSPPSCCCSIKNGATRSTASRRR